MQIHAFNYIDGLSGEVGDLLLLPGSHKRCAGNVSSVPSEVHGQLTDTGF